MWWGSRRARRSGLETTPGTTGRGSLSRTDGPRLAGRGGLLCVLPAGRLAAHPIPIAHPSMGTAGGAAVLLLAGSAAPLCRCADGGAVPLALCGAVALLRCGVLCCLPAAGRGRGLGRAAQRRQPVGYCRPRTLPRCSALPASSGAARCCWLAVQSGNGCSSPRRSAPPQWAALLFRVCAAALPLSGPLRAAGRQVKQSVPTTQSGPL